MRWIVILVGLVVAGCGSTAIVPTPFNADKWILKNPINGSQDYESAFWLVADTQLHQVGGEPSRSKSFWIDKFAKFAIRPPTLDIWSEAVLEQTIENLASVNDPNVPVIVLGDAANVSCIDEFNRFAETMNRARRDKPWFFLPGNHDGFYMGNLTYLPDASGTSPVSNT